MSEEQNPFLLVGRVTLGTCEKETFTKAFDAPSAIPSPLEAIESARTQARAELRDRFAMAALTGLLANGSFYLANHLDQRAKAVWAEADAMLKARGDE